MAEYQEERILSTILQRLGIEKIDMTDFDNRLRYQKLIYLLQNYGVSLGYGYSWYVRGPYSPPLTRNLFTIENNKETFENAKPVAFAQEKAIDSKIKGLQDILGEKITDAAFLEVLASLVFIKKSSPKMTNGALFSELLYKKPRLKNIPNIDSIMAEASEMIPIFCD